MIYLVLTPPLSNTKTLESPQELFVVLHNLLRRKGFKNIFQKHNRVSLEIVSSEAEGIRFIAAVPEALVSGLKAALIAHLPEIKIKQVQDYIVRFGGQVDSYRQTSHFAYPLMSNSFLDRQDNLAFLTNAMTKLESSELMAFQLLIKPTNSRKAAKLRALVKRNEDIEAYISNPIRGITSIINKCLFLITDTVTFAYHGNRQAYSQPQKENFQKQQSALRLRPARILSPFEQEQYEAIYQKLRQPLFKVEIRTLVRTNDINEVHKRRKLLASAIATSDDLGHQRLRLSRSFSSKLRFDRFVERRFGLHPNILSARELYTLYHFPVRSSNRTENLEKSLSRILPAPVSLKSGAELDILLGTNKHQEIDTPIGLTAAERQRHVYIVGGTGNGKTTMLQYAIIQDIKGGKGVAVLDPHGDLAESLLGYVPEHRIKDVIYFNPDDVGYPIGMNLLELPEGLSGDELIREKDLVTESTISVMRKIFSDDDTGGHRIEYILRNTIQTALTLENPTLFTIYDLLNDTKFRQKVTRKLEDKDLRNFWRNELGKAGEFQKVKMAAGITAKIGRFLFSASAKRVLEQPKSTIDFDDILNSRKILICNFSKGLLGEDTSTLFGTTVLAKLQMASLRRARLKQADRQPFYLYVDEFQNFATMSFVQMLSEARKYKLFLTMAEQTTAQQDYQLLVDIILANVGTIICFRSGSPADERLLLPLFRPFIEENEISNLPAYNFYMRIAAINAQEPFSGETMLINQAANPELIKASKAMSRRLYTIKYEPKVFNEEKPGVKPTVNLIQQPIDT